MVTEWSRFISKLKLIGLCLVLSLNAIPETEATQNKCTKYIQILSAAISMSCGLVGCNTSEGSYKVLTIHQGVEIAVPIKNHFRFGLSVDGNFGRTREKNGNNFDAEIEVLQALINRYPPEFPSKILSRIFVTQEIKKIFKSIAADGLANPLYPRELFVHFSEIAGALDHEIGHIIWFQYGDSDTRSKWLSLRTGSDSYLMMRAREDSQGLSRGFGTGDYQRAYVSAYAMKSFDEDFAEVFASMMTGNKGFWNAVDKYPLLQRKVGMVLSILQKADSRFTEQYLRALDPLPGANNEQEQSPNK